MCAYSSLSPSLRVCVCVLGSLSLDLLLLKYKISTSFPIPLRRFFKKVLLCIFLFFPSSQSLCIAFYAQNVSFFLLLCVEKIQMHKLIAYTYLTYTWTYLMSLLLSTILYNMSARQVNSWKSLRERASQCLNEVPRLFMCSWVFILFSFIEHIRMYSSGVI